MPLTKEQLKDLFYKTFPNENMDRAVTEEDLVKWLQAQILAEEDQLILEELRKI